MRPVQDILKLALLTEKGTKLKEKENKYFFAVNKKATKLEIKKAVEEKFKVKVKRVTTMNMWGKTKRMGRFEGKRPNWKKAIVQLFPGETIELFEAV